MPRPCAAVGGHLPVGDASPFAWQMRPCILCTSTRRDEVQAGETRLYLDEASGRPLREVAVSRPPLRRPRSRRRRALPVHSAARWLKLLGMLCTIASALLTPDAASAGAERPAAQRAGANVVRGGAGEAGGARACALPLRGRVHLPAGQRQSHACHWTPLEACSHAAPTSRHSAACSPWRVGAGAAQRVEARARPASV